MLPRYKIIGLLLIGLVFCIVDSEIVPASAKCTGDTCNTVMLPAEGRVSCLHCNGDDCDEPKSQVCNSYTTGEQCYIFFDNETHSAVRMGCKSSVPAGAIYNDPMHYFLCDGDDCNNYSNLPEAHICYVCNSKDDVNCVTNITKITTKVRCQIEPYTDCFVRIDDAGHTVRGCISTLNRTEFLTCIEGTPSQFCRICTENDCNSVKYPYSRQSCYRCNSADDPKCEKQPDTYSICPIFEEGNDCVTKFVDGVVHRGCGNELECEANSTTCRICDSDLCNNYVFEEYPVGDPGYFQTLPLTCYHCNSREECSGSNLGKLQKCENNSLQTCTTVFNSTSGDVIGRGCSDALLKECDDDESKCYDCKSNGCNLARKQEDYIDCIFCDAQKDKRCLTDVGKITATRKCHKSCVTTFYNRTNDATPVRELIRTCLDDIPLVDRENCASGKDASCVACDTEKCNNAHVGHDGREKCTEENNCARCTGDKCNMVMLPAEGRVSCLHCNGDDCDEPKSKVCNSYSASEQCYIFFDHETHSAVRMGCKSSEPAGAIYNDAIHYFICDGDDCNNYSNLPEAHICYVCNSKDDVNCAISMSKIKTKVRCQINPHTDCFTRIDDDGHTERGCISTLNNTQFLVCHEGTPHEFCRICTESNCNSINYPTSRQSCYRCNSADDPNCEKQPDKSSLCPIFKEGDDCVTKFVDGVVYRGCGTELECEANSKTCRRCANDYCNRYVFKEYPVGDPGYFQTLPLTCYHCNSREECSGSNLGKLQKCENNSLQTCTTVFNSTSGDVIGRGCSDAFFKECDDDERKCYDCKSNGCNLARKQEDYIDCIFCDAQKDKRCLTDVGKITATRKCHKSCVTTLYNRTNDATPERELIRTCLDDMELDDRKNCASGKDATCVACDTEKCNTAHVNKRISCYHCVGDDCDEPLVKDCAKENDQCYIRIDESFSFIGMGCASTLGDETVIANLIKKKELYICLAANCNGYENLPATNECTACDSNEDVKCAVQPSTAGKSKRCGNVPYTQCYERVNATNDGTTERGCLVELEGGDFYNCLMGQDKNCNVCVGNACNTGVVPADRLQCQRCYSESDSTCASAPSALSICPQYSINDTCVSVHESGVTRRGCLSEITCDVRMRNCEICAGNGCNTANVQKRAEELYGVFQDLPLNCYTCTGNECATSKGKVRKCNDDIYQDCLTVFDGAGNVLARGCESTVNPVYGAHCALKPELCFNCKSNGCNNLTAVPITQECIYCDANNANCLTNPLAVTSTRKCVEGCVSALYSRKTNPNVQDLARTCFEDLEIDDRETCTEENNCVRCTGDKCNTVMLPAEGRVSCLHCNGDDCDEPKSKVCNSYSASEQCYIFFDHETHSAVRMGCKSSEPAGAIYNDAIHYFLCDGDDCNNYSNLPEAHMCYVCNSKDDVNCAINMSKITTKVRCQINPHTDCFVRIDDDGHTERGCISTLNNTQFLVCHEGTPYEFCRICTESNCNNFNYPSSRQSCYRCNSADDPNCEKQPDTYSLCPIFDEGDECVTKFVDGVVYRGCGTELECDANSKTCRKCDDALCNDYVFKEYPIGDPGYFQTLPLNCYHCNSREECSGSSLGKLRKCENNSLQTCTTVFNSTSGDVIGRGCSDALLKQCDDDESKCYDCKSNGCNLARKQEDYIDCTFCDAQKDERCLTDVGKITATRKCHKSCVTTLYNRTNDATPVRELIRTCLDDMDLDDRETCTSGKDERCVACDTEKCNNAHVGERISCYQCVGDECQVPVAKTCRAVTEGDQCFVEYDETGSIVELGCKSKYDPAEVKLRIIAKRLWLCDGENCNSIDNLPVDRQVCKICSSLTDRDCAIAPNRVTAQTSCAKRPYNQCYSRVLKGGHTERGCLSSIEGEEFYECLTGADPAKCLACIGDKCNEEIFPAGRRSCHHCNSKEDPSCESSPDAAQICPLFNKNQFCATKLVKGYTYRGCSTEFQCDVSNRQYCRHCVGSDNCNTVDLSSNVIGLPGKFQNLPLSCRNCTSGDCATSASGSLHQCEKNNIQHCETVFGPDGTVVRRGCSDDVLSTHGDYCEENPQKCLGCKSNGCNNATALTQFVDCYSCDSAEDDICAVDFVTASAKKRKCQGHCAVALYPRIGAEKPTYELTRTCLDDLELADREKCLAGENELCVACKDALCNTASMPANRQKCYKCVNGDCADNVVAECSLYQPDDQCYMAFDDENSILDMGCRSDLDSEIVEELIKQKKLLLCDGVACNGPESIPTAKTCSVCDSKTDARCATNPNLVADTERCSNIPYTQCYTRVKEDGHTARGCLSNLPADIFYNCVNGSDTLCLPCLGDKCNGLDVFPTDRQQCHQCNSETEPLCSSAPNSNKVCPIYSPTDSCITNLRDGVTTRGCASSISCDNENDHRTCRICSDSGCNTVNLEAALGQGEPGRWQDLPLTCRTCVGEAACESLGVYRVCTGNKYQSCMTVFNTAGKVIQRGCSDTVEVANIQHCSDNPTNCLKCNSNGCNNSTRLADYIDCLYCDADSNANCLNNAASVNKTRKCNTYCMSALYTKYEESNPAYGFARTCFDDMDLDEREACAAGNNPYCHVCAEANCNTHIVPAKRLSCNVCKDDECQDPQPSTCINYREDDKCYIQFDEGRNIIGMGCRSEFSNADADYLLQKKRLFYCDGDNCNNFDALPVAQNCRLCSSRTDVQCATNPDLVRVSTRCSYLPYTECYTRVLESGITERGCLSSLYDDDFASCLNGTAPYCTACKGKNCNNKVYPEKRLSCHICDSATDATCANKPNSVTVCPIYVENDACVTSYKNDVTYRGCNSSITCDPSDTKKCVQCVGEACNTVNLARKQDDNFGKWQDLPLTCLTCSGETACANVNSAKSHTCVNNNEQDCVTVFQNGKVVQRGCSDEVEQVYGDYCDANIDDCLNCKSNNCNNGIAQTQYNNCIYCDSHKNLSCLWSPQSDKHNTRKCQGACMTALYPSDSSIDPTYELIRTCLDDKEASDRLDCTSDNDAECQSCVGANCNTVVLPAERLSCYQCVGENCDEPELKYCPLFKNSDKCFTWYDESNSITQMGCLSSFRNQGIETIIGTKRVLVCDGDACNSLAEPPTPHKCAVCDSNTDYACAVNALGIGTFDTCSNYPYTNCYTKLVSRDGSTKRGCLTDLDAAEFSACVLGNDKNCSVCLGEGCNREVFPEDRQQCYKCSSEDDSNCESNPSRLEPCPYVAETEFCRAALSNNITVRGCSSEILCDVNDRNCVSCVGTACNGLDLKQRAEDDGMHGLWQDLPLRCHTCEGEHCLQSLGPAYNCSGNVEQDCVTVFNADGEVKRRGCSLEVELHEQRHCRENPHLCFTCKSNECNDAWDISDYIDCNFCDSETNPLCATDPLNTIFPKRACQKECMVALKGSRVIRSCLDDKELYHRYQCREEGDNCSSCDTPNCNNFVYPADRFSCHVCSDSSCATSVSQLCPKSVADDYCFAKYNNGEPQLLGCASSQSDSDLAAWERENILFTCREKDCNAMVKLPTEGVKCLACDSSLTPACAQNAAQVTSTETCAALQKQCVTHLSTAGHTLRGCLSKLSQAEQSSCQAAGSCAICEGNSCNNEIFPNNRRKCHICKSSVNSQCAKDPNFLQICPVYKANDRCVTTRGEFTERGCESSQLSCDTSDERKCQICTGDGCNTVELKGSAALVSTASLLTSLVFAIIAMLVIT